MFFDFCKAFDMVDNTIILEKIKLKTRVNCV